MTMQGLIRRVDNATPRTFLAAAALEGDVQLAVTGAEVFLADAPTGADSDEGTTYPATGEVSIAGVSYPFVEVFDADDDAAPAVLTLGAALEADVAAGEPVELVGGGLDTWATVLLAGDEDGNGDVATARVSHSLLAYRTLRLGPREAGQEELALLQYVRGVLTVMNIEGEAPTLDAETVVGPLSNADLPLPTDGLPPADAPEVTLVPGMGVVYLRLVPPANDDPIIGYTVYVNGDAVTTDPATLIPVAVDGAGSLLPYDTDSTFTASASDADGEGPQSAPIIGRPLAVSLDDLAGTILDQIDAAGAAADAAQTVADAANAAAIAAATAAAAAQATADNAIRTYYQATAPTGLVDPDNVGDLWFDTDDNQAYRWGGTAPGWVIIEDNSIAAALSAAAAAQSSADAAAALATSAVTTANGKNRNTFSASSSAPATTDRVEGDVHTQIVAGVAVKQWSLVAGAWDERKIDGAVLTNLDAASITTGILSVALLLRSNAIVANSVYAQSGYIGTLTANQITSGELAAVVALIGSLKVGGDLIEVSPPTSAPDGNGGLTLSGGIIIRDPANPTGEPLVRLHPSGCTFRGKMVADIVTVLQDLIINGNASISGGSTLTFRAGLPDPLTAPAGQVGPLVAQSWPAAPASMTRKGYAWDATNGRWIELLRESGGTLYIRTITTAGVASATTPLSTAGVVGDLVSGNGIAVLGSSLYYSVSTRDSGTGIYRTYLAKASLAGALSSMTQIFTGFASVAGANGGVSTYAGQISVAVSVAGGAVDQYLGLFNASTSALVKYARFTFDPQLVGVGTFDFGVERVVSTGSGVKFWTPTWATSGTPAYSAEDASKAFPADGVLNADALFWDGTNFLTISGTQLRKWHSFYPGAADATWSAVYVDKSASGNTLPSPPMTITVGPRQFVTLTLPPAPSGVIGADVWVGYAAAGNAATKYKRAEVLAGRTLVLTAGKQTTGSQVIPSTNSAGGSPAKVRSETQPGWEGSGDGTFKVKTPTTDTEAAPKKYVDDKVAAVVMPDWGPWVDIASKIAAGPTGVTLEIRRRGKDRQIRLSVTWSWTTFQSRNIVAVGSIDAGDRPSATQFAFAYMEGARPGSAFLRADGSIAVANMATDTRTTAQSTIPYTVD